jgi:hypothetical protein
VEDFGHELRPVIKFPKSKGGRSMEDQEQTRPEEQDVEAHGNLNSPTKGAPTKGREDDGDDVEAHGNMASPTKGAPTKGREDDGDDVEAHMNLNAPTKGGPTKG